MMRMSGWRIRWYWPGMMSYDDVRIDRRRYLFRPGLDLGDEAQQLAAVVTFGKTLAVHDASTLQFGRSDTGIRPW